VNNDVFEGKWKQLRGRAKEWWGDITNDELDRVNGQREQMIGLLQEKYGYARDRAEAELDRRVRQL
jgi:uncharacterized protein YjbJ (UPF0337 family)